MASYNFLATLRLHDGGAMTVGPNRRVVFGHGVKCDKGAIKRALAPLAGYWCKPDQGAMLSNKPLMSYFKFRQSARILLVDAGLLTHETADDDGAFTMQR